MAKTQVLFIHGGMTFKNQKDYMNYLKTKEPRLEAKKSWSRSYLDKKLGRNYQVIRPRMPLSDNAKYSDWKIVFENYIKAMDKEIILIGSSLGAMFLSKYLSENKLRGKKIIGTFLVAGAYDASNSNEDLVGGFMPLPKDLSMLNKNCKCNNLYFSVDDECIPPYHCNKFMEALPEATIKMFTDKNGHFVVSKFPELIKDIKACVKASKKN